MRRHTLTAIVPVAGDSHLLDQCLRALASRCRCEVVVVSDGIASKRALESVAAWGARLVSLPEQIGHGAARNKGAKGTDSDWLLFVDSDVVVECDPEDVIGSCDLNDCDAVVGRYSDNIGELTTVSALRMLWNNYIIGRKRTSVVSFWSGLAAVRRSVFDAVGGFDESLKFMGTVDIAFGDKLRRQNFKVCLAPRLKAVHLKRWTLLSSMRSDLIERALPWARLTVEGRTKGAFMLDFGAAKTTMVCVALSLITIPFLWFWTFAVVIFVAGVVVAGGVHVHYLRQVKDRMGIVAALGAIFFIYLRYVMLPIGLAIAYSEQVLWSFRH